MRLRLVSGLTMTGLLLSVLTVATGQAQAAAPLVDPTDIATQMSLAVAKGATDSELASEFDVEKLPTTVESVIRPLSTTGQMNTQAPKIYYSSSGGYYYLVADWGWSSNGWKTDTPSTLTPSLKNIGGADAYGVWFSKPINNLNGSMAICGKQIGGFRLPSCWTSKSYKANNQYGEAISFQDKSVLSTLRNVGATNADRGSMVFPFKWIKKGCRQFGSHYAHTWSSTSITGIGVQPYGFNVAWSSTSKHWGEDSAVASFGC